ncbi:cobalamin-dependent protein, partial [Acinetobacter baumannii]
MRILLLHPNYHSGGAEIAGNWPPAWAAYISGALRKAGFGDIRFVDAMTNDLSEEQVRQILIDEKPEMVGCTAITP